MVMVFQEYDSTSASTGGASLPPCIVGPCYHIIDAAEDETLALYGPYDKSGVDSGFFPNNAPGALIDKESVQLRFKNAMVLLLSDLEPAAGGLVRNSVTFAAGSFVERVAVGDYVSFTDITDPENPVETGPKYRVIGTNADESSIMLNRSAPALDPAVVRVSVIRKQEELLLPWNDPRVFLDVTGERFTVTGVTQEIDGLDCLVLNAELYVGYRALRQDLSDIFTLDSIDEVRGRLGKIVPENPLAYGVAIAMANAAISVKCIGVDSDDLVGYTAAKDRLENHDPVYAIVPLTFSPAVLAMFKNHAAEMSQPTQGRWRMAIGCTQLTRKKRVSEGRGTVSVDGDGDLCVLEAVSEGTNFLSHSVDAGDELYMTDSGGQEHRYVIASVVAEDTLTVVQSACFDPAVFIAGEQYAFHIMHTLDKLEQAKTVADTSRGYGNPRFVNVWPDVCVVDDRELPGYFLGCALAGGIGGLPSHQGLTRLSISGIDAVKHSSDYFTQEHLDTIADGGTCIFVQASQTAPPHIRHQLTTDRSTLEFQELSFVKNFDYISYVCRDAMDQFLGQYNVTKGTLSALGTALRACLETLRLETFAKIGSRVVAFSITSIQQLEDVRDRVEMYADVQMPYPLNTIGLHLRSTQLQVISSAS